MQAYNDFYADPYGDYTPKHLYPWDCDAAHLSTINFISGIYKLDEYEIFELGINTKALTDNPIWVWYNFARYDEYNNRIEVFQELQELGDDFDEFIKQLVQDEVDIDEWSRNLF
jgi:hypothetical protein